MERAKETRFLDSHALLSDLLVRTPWLCAERRRMRGKKSRGKGGRESGGAAR